MSPSLMSLPPDSLRSTFRSVGRSVPATQPPSSASQRGGGREAEQAAHALSTTPSDMSETNLTPLHWSSFFNQRQMIQVESVGEFCVYTAAPGLMSAAAAAAASASAASSASSSAAAHSSYAQAVPSPLPSLPSPSPSPPPFLVLLLHGGGQSSMSWACVAGYLRHGMAVMTFDMRGHGASKVKDEHDWVS